MVGNQGRGTAAWKNLLGNLGSGWEWTLPVWCERPGTSEGRGLRGLGLWRLWG